MSFSYWEQKEFLNFDHIIIGAGLSGLFTAFFLKRKFPDRDIAVFERGLLPLGASTRNAGFACSGSLSELLDDLKTQNPEEVTTLFYNRRKGLELLKTELGEDYLEPDRNGSYELIFENNLEILDRIEEVNALLNQQIFEIRDEKIRQYSFNETIVKHLLKINGEYGLNIGKLMKILMQKVQTSGVKIFYGVHIHEVQEYENKVLCLGHHADMSYSFSSKQLTVCTNAFVSRLFPDLNIVPGRGQVFITKPIPGLKIKGIFHFDRGYYYFREIHNRILMGGGRNLDMKTEESLSFDINDKIQKDLEQKLKTFILPDTEYTIDTRWTGIMAFGKSKEPLIEHRKRISVCAGFGGMGVALSSLKARELVDGIE